jgi:hypothetical protein
MQPRTRPAHRLLHLHLHLLGRGVFSPMPSMTLSFDELVSPRLLEVPDYQRGYAWEGEHLREFWEDLDLIEPGRRHTPAPWSCVTAEVPAGSRAGGTARALRRCRWPAASYDMRLAAGSCL